MKAFKPRYAITFGEGATQNYGSEEIGKLAETGFTVLQLQNIKQKVQEMYGMNCNLYNLTESLPEQHRQGNEAAVLHLPNFIDHVLEQENIAQKLFQEQEGLVYDKKYYDFNRKKTLNKRARHLLVFGDQAQKASEDFQTYTIMPFKQLKFLNLLRQKLPLIFGSKANQLKAEGNCYFEKNSGVGFHGDGERKIVICACLGSSSTLRYYWRVPKKSQNTYGPIDVKVKHGDMYIMSQKAVGNDWLKSSRFRLVHAAGSTKYIGHK